jgi:hypothetical protein
MNVVAVNGRLCVLMDEMGCFEFWSFYVDIHVMLVYVVDSDSHVSSCLGGLSEKKLRIYCEGVVVLYAFSVVLCVCTFSFWRSVVGSLVTFLFAVFC